MRKKYIILQGLAMAFLALLFSCGENTLDPAIAQDREPKDIKTVPNLRGVLVGALDKMCATEYYGRNFIIYGEVRSDNCFVSGNSGRFTEITTMKTASDGRYPNGTWEKIYSVISSANLVISKKDEALTGDAETKKHLVGQAYAIRALAHFDLLKLFGQQHVGTGGLNALGIPYVKKYKPTGADLTPKRNTVAEVKNFIYEDLKEALTTMMSAKLNEEKTFITIYAVNAIKSRVALYFNDWDNVIAACEEVMKGGFAITPKDAYVEMWKGKKQANSIFELAFSGTDNRSYDCIAQMYRRDSKDESGYAGVAALPELLNIFDDGDVRKSAGMIGIQLTDKGIPFDGFTRNIGKYPDFIGADNIILFRIEEIILNYAEALLGKNETSKALAELNKITAARGAKAHTEATEANIRLERRRELCFEGFRFDDLARTKQDIPSNGDRTDSNKAPVVYKYGNYNYAFPIPQQEREVNLNLKQNEGYTPQ